MIVKEILLKATKILKKTSSEPGLDAEVLLGYVLKKPKAWLYAHPEKKLTKSQEKKNKQLINKRLKGGPIAYIVGYKEFFSLNFYVDKRVLIPCPETELLIEEILKSVSVQKRAQKRILIADIGTGSGNIAITLAKHLTGFKIYAIDISKDALKVAQKNAKKHQVKKQITFLLGNLCQPLPEKVDIIVANLPYVPSKEAAKLKHGPLKALDGGKSGLKYLKLLLKNAPDYLKNNGQIFLEIDSRQGAEIKKLIKKYLPRARVKIKKDLAGLDRIVIITGA